MYLPGHLGLALLAGAVLLAALGARRRVGVVAGGLAALATAPDVDLFLAGVPHRGPTHTVWAALGLGVGLAVVGGLAVRRRGGVRPAARLGFAIGVGSCLTHLLGDVITPMGIRPFAPLVTATYTLDLVAARNPTANRALLGAGLLAVALALALRREQWVPGVRAGLRRAAPADASTRGE